MLGFDLEDAELGAGVRGRGFIAERTLGEARPGFPGGDELTRELDEIGGDGGLLGVLVEDGMMAELDLFFEGEALVFMFVEVELAAGRSGVWGRCAGEAGGGVLFVTEGLNGEAGKGDWRGCGGVCEGGLADGRCGRGGEVAGEEGGVVEGAEGNGGDGDRSGGLLCGTPGVEVGEELLLRDSDGLGIDGGDLGGCLGLVDGALGFGGEEGAIGLGVRVALGDGGGDVGGADARGAGARGLCGDGNCEVRGGGEAATSAVGGDAFGGFAAERRGGVGLGEMEGRLGRGLRRGGG